MIARDRILTKPQVRTRGELKDIESLRENISELKKRNLGIEGTGMLQPITVTPATEADTVAEFGEPREHYFRLVFGHRRFHLAALAGI